jgi:hypothetical protein
MLSIFLAWVLLADALAALLRSELPVIADRGLVGVRGLASELVERGFDVFF